MDKSLFEFKGTPLIQCVTECLKSVFTDVAIIANDAEKFRFLGLETTPDLIPGLGPLGGIYTALVHAGKKRIFITGCDMPWLNADLIRHMVSIPDRYDIIVPSVKGQYEPLHAIYSNACLEPVIKAINSGKRKIIVFYENLNVRKVTEEEIINFGDPRKIFRNINYPEDSDI